MSQRRFFARAALLIVATASCGCAPQAATVKPYFGSTQTLDQLVDDINTNVEPIPTLWARGDFDATIIDHGHKTQVSGDAHLIYARPQQMLLVGSADVIGEVFRMGSSSEKYWLTVKGDADTTWWGTFAKIDSVDPTQIPVRPDLVEAVFGLDQLDTDLNHQPCPVMRFNNDRRAYMIVWNQKFRDRWVAQKEVWYDLDSKLPVLVNLFDANGRVVLSAYLSDHQPVDTGQPKSSTGTVPKLATQYRLFFPDSGSTLQLHLKDMALKHMNVPNALTFNFNPETAGAKHVVDLDETAH